VARGLGRGAARRSAFRGRGKAELTKEAADASVVSPD